LLLSGGGEHLSSGQDGLAYLVGELLDEGTQTKTSIDIADIIDRAGGYLYSAADWESLFVSAGVMSSQLQPVLEVLADVVMDSTFPIAEVERLKSRQLTAQVNRRVQPGVLANETMLNLLYATTCYEFPMIGTSDSVEKFERDDILTFATQHLTPVKATLILVGDLDTNNLLEQVSRLFGNWKGEEPPSIPEIRPPQLSERVVTIVDRPNAAQTELRLGHVGLPRAHPDYYPVRVMNSILGGKFSSRLNLNLRERQGFTYGISSQFSGRRGAGPFIVGAAVATENAGQAVTEILSELHRIQDTAVGKDELREAKSYLQGVFPYSLQTIDGVAGRLVEISLHDLPDDYYDSHLDSIGQVDVEAVQMTARDHLRPDQMAIVAVGPRDMLEEQLADFGRLEIQTDDAPAA
jgi:zinc protease